VRQNQIFRQKPQFPPSPPLLTSCHLPADCRCRMRGKSSQLMMEYGLACSREYFRRGERLWLWPTCLGRATRNLVSIVCPKFCASNNLTQFSWLSRMNGLEQICESCVQCGRQLCAWIRREAGGFRPGHRGV
jgi:hypothetical protein